MAAPNDVFITVVIDEEVAAEARKNPAAATKLITEVLDSVNKQLETYLGVTPLDAES